MDPNAALRDIREMANLAMNGDAGLAASPDAVEDLLFRLASAFGDLDAWLVNGGFLPDKWREAVPRPGMNWSKEP